MAGVHHVNNRLVLSFTIAAYEDGLIGVGSFGGFEFLHELTLIEVTTLDRNTAGSIDRYYQRVRRSAHCLHGGRGREFHVVLLVVCFFREPRADHEKDDEQKHDVDHRRQVQDRFVECVGFERHRCIEQIGCRIIGVVCLWRKYTEKLR